LLASTYSLNRLPAVFSITSSPPAARQNSKAFLASRAQQLNPNPIARLGHEIRRGGQKRTSSRQTTAPSSL
jgi:hypothetical protein